MREIRLLMLHQVRDTDPAYIKTEREHGRNIGAAVFIGTDDNIIIVLRVFDRFHDNIFLIRSHKRKAFLLRQPVDASDREVQHISLCRCAALVKAPLVRVQRICELMLSLVSGRSGRCRAS